MRKILRILLLLLVCVPSGAAFSQTPDWIVNFAQKTGSSPQSYGSNGWWSDEDQDFADWQARYSGLWMNTVRLSMPHSIIEPENDNNNAGLRDQSKFRFDKPFEIDGDRVATPAEWIPFLKSHDYTLIVHFTYLAPWIAKFPVVYPPQLGFPSQSPYPPGNYAEYQEFIEATLYFLVHEMDYPQDKIILEAMNEPDLTCGGISVCFWYEHGSGNYSEADKFQDIRQVVKVTEQAIQKIAPGVRLIGLAECCGTKFVQKLLEETPEGKYLDGLTYHYYDESGKFDVGTALARANTLEDYGLPVYLDEFGTTTYKSNGQEGALWHSYALPTFWQAGINPIQYAISEWGTKRFPNPNPIPFNEMGLFKDWSGNFAIKPSYWVYANFFRLFGGKEVISSSGLSGMETLAARQNTSYGKAFLWVANWSSTSVKGVTIEVRNFPARQAELRIYNNLSSSNPTQVRSVSGDPLQFDFSIPANSSWSFELIGKPEGWEAYDHQFFLPMLGEETRH